MWSIFSQSSIDDESTNSKYCTSGIFKIGCEDLVTKYPVVQASVKSKRMVVAIDKSVILLEDENVAKCSFLCFGSLIEALAVSESGNLIICCLADGDIHGVFIKGVPVFNLTIQQDDIKNNKTFVGIEQIGKEYYITCTNGSLYRLTNIDESRFELAGNMTMMKENETLAIDETILDSVLLERISATKSVNEITSFVLLQRDDIDEDSSKGHLFIGGTKCFLRFQEPENDVKVIIPEHFCGVKAIYNLDNFLIGLTNSGHLVEICPYTKLFFNSFSSLEYLIDDLVIMENNEEIIELLLLTKENQDGNRFMKIVEFPSFQCSYELQMNRNTWLVKQPKSSVNLYYISADDTKQHDYPKEIEMKLVSETQPADRLKKLIHKGHLEEAEEFGIQFNLSLQPIFEAKAKKILLDIKNSKDSDIKAIEEKLKNLINVMHQIENKSFLSNIRSMEIPCRTVLNSFLQEVLNLLHNEDEKYERDIYEIKEQQLRLETLNIIDPYECNMEWQKFVYHPSIIKMCNSYFKTDLPIACIIWKRHSSSIIPQLGQNDALKLLQRIPSSAEAFEIVQWLRHFIPTVVQCYPKIMPSIIEWIIQKTRSLQFSMHWPDVGLEFSTKVLNIFNDISFLHSDVSRQHERSIEKLRNLVNALQALSVLKKTYNLIFTLDNYMKDSLDGTAFCVLQRVQLVNLRSLVSDFLYPLYMEKGKSPVEAIIQYIHFLVGNKIGLSTWLERAVACIDLLYNEEEKLKCSLMVLQAAPVPWTDVVTPLIKLRNSTHPIATQIGTEFEIQVIKIMKAKYGYPPDSTESNMKLVFRIVKVGLPEMIQDIKDLTKATPEIQSSANFYCCYELSRIGKIENAFNFFNSLEETQRAECSEKIINIFTNILEDQAVDEASLENIFEFFKLIIPHSKKSGREHLMQIRNKHILKRKFKLDLPRDLKSEKSVFLQKGLEFIINAVDNNRDRVDNVSYVWKEVSELCQALGLHQLTGILEISKKYNKLHFTCALAVCVLDLIDPTETNSELFVNLAITLVAQQVEVFRAGEDNNNGDPMPYPIAYKLLVKASNFSKIHQTEMIELLKWIRIVNINYSLTAVRDFYEDKNAVRKMINKMLNGVRKENGLEQNVKKRPSISIFDETVVKAESPTTSLQNEISPIAKCVSLSLLIVLTVLKCKNPAFERMKSHLPETFESQQEELNKHFFKSLEHLLKSKQYSNWYTIVQYLLSYNKDNEHKVINSSYVSMHLRKIFRHSLMQKDPNFIDLYAMLISDVQPRLMLENLNGDVKTDQQKVNLMLLSEMYYTHTEDMAKVKIIRESRMKNYYYSELCKQDSSLKTRSDIEMVSMSQLMKEMRHKVLNVNLLEKLSKDFDWDYEQILISQVITVLNLQEPIFEIKTDVFGKEELVMKSTVEEIKQLCQPYINEITNTELLATKLLNFITEINYYFYELYLSVVEILTYINALPKEMELWTNILVFLKHKLITKRRPGQLEMDWWLKSQSEVGVLPKIAKYRLPFIPIVQKPLKDILDTEVNVDNCESWFPLIRLHTILQGSSSADIVKMQDYFCMSAVKNSISEYKQQNDSDKWHLEPVNNAFLQSILRLVKHVSCESKILLILYFVASHAPDGADQVEASYECYKFALKNEAILVTNDKSSESVVKIKRKYPILKTQHFLHIYGLIEDKLLQIVENPKDLIHALYHHEMILKPSKPDINKICEEIANLHGLDFYLLQISLLQKWLSFTATADATDMEETFYEDMNTSNSINGEDINPESVIRAQYILRSWESEKAMQFLVCHIFSVDGTGNTSKQLQMYECFSQLVDEENASYTDVLNQRQYITIKCVHDLKQLGYNFTVEKFTEYDKISILKKLWQNHSNSQFAMQVIANICLGFDIYISKVWNGVLKKMVKFNMVKELNSLVEKLSCTPELLHTEGLVNAWECILKLPFKKANRTRSAEQEETLSRTMFMIQSCPLVTKLNLLEIAEDCVRLERPHMAAILIAFCGNEEQRTSIKKLLQPYRGPQIKTDIHDLEESGILPSIVNFVLKELEL